MSGLPAEEDVLSWFVELSNWGRWGADDVRGTLNLITPQVRRKAAQLVQDGMRVSCCRDLQADGNGQVQRFMVATGEGLADEHRVHRPANRWHDASGERMGSAGEFLGVAYHGHTVTHVDALSHMFWDRQMYNGKPAELVTATLGATHGDITAAREGIFTRGVLIDVPALRGVDWLEAGEGVLPYDLEAAEKQMGFRIGEGDAVLIRTGYPKRKREIGPIPWTEGQPGWHVASLPWLHERGVALIGGDTATDVLPSGYSVMPLPVHVIGIAAMGLWTVDNCDLEQVASKCADLGRWQFLFTLDPLPIVGGTGSPANPIATF